MFILAFFRVERSHQSDIIIKLKLVIKHTKPDRNFLLEKRLFLQQTCSWKAGACVSFVQAVWVWSKFTFEVLRTSSQFRAAKDIKFWPHPLSLKSPDKWTPSTPLNSPWQLAPPITPVTYPKPPSSSIEINAAQFSRSNTIKLSAPHEITCNLGRYFIYIVTAPRLRHPNPAEIAARIFHNSPRTLVFPIIGPSTRIEIYLLLLHISSFALQSKVIH